MVDLWKRFGDLIQKEIVDEAGRQDWYSSQGDLHLAGGGGGASGRVGDLGGGVREFDARRIDLVS